MGLLRGPSHPDSGNHEQIKAENNKGCVPWEPRLKCFADKKNVGGHYEENQSHTQAMQEQPPGIGQLEKISEN